MAQINVGAATETEMKERKSLLEDAKAATQAALRRRHRPRRRRGPDSRPKRRIDKLDLEGRRKARRRDHHATCSTHPLRYIAENAGVDGAVVVNRVRQMKGKNEGYDADKDEYGDLVAAGIIDPAKVVHTRPAKRAPASPRCCSPPSRSITEIPKEEEDEAAATTITTTAWAVAWVEWAVAWAAWVAWAA